LPQSGHEVESFGDRCRSSAEAALVVEAAAISMSIIYASLLLWANWSFLPTVSRYSARTGLSIEVCAFGAMKRVGEKRPNLLEEVAFATSSSAWHSV